MWDHSVEATAWCRPLTDTTAKQKSTTNTVSLNCTPYRQLHRQPESNCCTGIVAQLLFKWNIAVHCVHRWDLRIHTNHTHGGRLLVTSSGNLLLGNPNKSKAQSRHHPPNAGHVLTRGGGKKQIIFLHKSAIRNASKCPHKYSKIYIYL